MASGRVLLVLTVTRQCNMACTYCPTVKEGGALTASDAEQAIDWFADDLEGGDLKLTGGEPLLHLETVDAALAAADRCKQIGKVRLSTNGLLLDAERLDRLAAMPKVTLALSLDGAPEVQSAQRSGESYAHLRTLLPDLLQMPRLVINQVVTPASAHRAADDFRHLLSLGFRKVNLLPAYLVVWGRRQAETLRRSLHGIAAIVREEEVELDNLNARSATPFFNDGVIVDSDRSIHVSNLGLAQALADCREQTRIGDLDAPPTHEQIAARRPAMPGLLERSLPREIWRSTRAVDACLTELCDSLAAAGPAS